MTGEEEHKFLESIYRAIFDSPDFGLKVMMTVAKVYENKYLDLCHRTADMEAALVIAASVGLKKIKYTKEDFIEFLREKIAPWREKSFCRWDWLFDKDKI